MSPNAFEDRIRSLSARGFRVSVTLHTPEYGEDRGKQIFLVSLSKGSYSSADLSAKGQGSTLDQAAEAALRSAEAYLSAMEPPAVVKGALADMATANLLPGE